MTTQHLWMKLLRTRSRLDPAVQELEDRRRHARTRALLPVSFARSDRPDHRFQQGQTGDFSSRGVFLQTEAPLAPGTHLLLEIEERAGVLSRRGVVCWTRAGDGYEAPPSGMGIHILDGALPAALRRREGSQAAGAGGVRLAATYQLIIEDSTEPLARAG